MAFDSRLNSTSKTPKARPNNQNLPNQPLCQIRQRGTFIPVGFPGGTGGSPCKLGGLQVSSKAVFPVESLGMLCLFPGGMEPKSPDFMGESYCRVISPTRRLRFVRQLAGKADCRPEEARRICADQTPESISGLSLARRWNSGERTE